MSEECLKALEALVQSDEGGRGIQNLKLPLGELQKMVDFLGSSSHVLLLTGFPCVDPSMLQREKNSEGVEKFYRSESDGLQGTLAVARSLLREGGGGRGSEGERGEVEVVLMSESETVDLLSELWVRIFGMLQDTEKLDGGKMQQMRMIGLEPGTFWSNDEVLGTQTTFAISEQNGNVGGSNLILSSIKSSKKFKKSDFSHFLCCAIERAGPGSDGHSRTMSGRVIDEFLSPAVGELAEGLPMVCCGDGGNEMGTGKVGEGKEEGRRGRRCIQVSEFTREFLPLGSEIACKVSSEACLISGTCNWGAFAIAAGIDAINSKNTHKDSKSFYGWSTKLERFCMEFFMENNVCDGKTQLPGWSVDGIHFEISEEKILEIEEILKML